MYDYETKNISQEELLNSSFYKLPKFLFTENFKKMSNDAKMLYAILSDRMDLSIKNNWIDKNGDVFIYFTNKDLMEMLNCGSEKLIKLKKELRAYRLLEEKRQGLTKPNMLYVRNVLKCEKRSSGKKKNEGQDILKSNTNKTDVSKTNFNQTEETTTTTINTQMQEEIPIREIDVSHLKDKIEKTIGKIGNKGIKKLIAASSIETVNYYLDNWNKFDGISMKSKMGFFISACIEGYSLPLAQNGQNNCGVYQPPQSTNYEQREYSDEDLESLYANAHLI